MKRAVAFLLMALVLLAACSGPKTTGKRVAIPETSRSPITGMASGVPSDSAPASTPAAQIKTAAEVLKELQSAGSSPAATSTGPKSGTFYPPVAVTGTGKDALKQKTRALFSQPTPAPGGKSDATTGGTPKYHGANGALKNLPDKYAK